MRDIFDLFDKILDFRFMWLWLWTIIIILIAIYFIWKIIYFQIQQVKQNKYKKVLLKQVIWKRYIEENVVQYFLWVKDWFFLKNITTDEKLRSTFKIIDKIDNKIIKFTINLKDDFHNELFEIIETLVEYECDDYFANFNNKDSLELKNEEREVIKNDNSKDYEKILDKDENESIDEETIREEEQDRFKRNQINEIEKREYNVTSRKNRRRK